MDVDVTEPIPTVDASTVATPPPGRNARPAMIVGGAALAVLLAAVAALVWTFSDDSKDAAKPKAIATAPSKAPAAAPPPAPAGPEKPGAKPGDAPNGIPGGLDPASLFGGSAADMGMTSSGPAFAAPGAPTYGSGGGPTGLGKPPNVEWPNLGWEDVAPAMALGLGGDDIANLVVDIGDWVYGAGLATANNSTDLFGDLLLYDAAIRAGSGGGSSLSTLVSSATAAGINPATALTEAAQQVSSGALVNPMAQSASTLNSLSEAASNSALRFPQVPSLGGLSMPELPSLGAPPQLPSLGAAPQLPSLGSLPQMPSLDAFGGLPKIDLPGMPQAPPGLPGLPSPAQIGLGAAVASNMQPVGLPQMPSLDFLRKLPPPGLPNVGPPRIGLPRFDLPRFGPPRRGLSVPSITKLMGLPF
jgi:hypothetical protein